MSVRSRFLEELWVLGKSRRSAQPPCSKIKCLQMAEVGVEVREGQPSKVFASTLSPFIKH